MFNIKAAIDNIESREIFRLMKQTLYDNYPYIEDSYHFLEICELYKIISAESLISLLNKDNKDEQVVHVKSEYIDNKFNPLYDKLHSSGFYIYYYDKANRVVTVASSMDNIDCPNIDLYFGDLKVERVAMTPLNYLMLSNPSRIAELTFHYIIFLRIVADGVIRGASDVKFSSFQLENNRTVYPIRFRVGNDLVPYTTFTLDEELNRKILADVVKCKSIPDESQMNTADGVLFPIYNCFGVDNYQLRVKMNKTNIGFLCNTRIMKMRNINGSNSLGFGDRVNSVISSMTRVDNGLCLVTGPQRSGKSTTLLAVFNEVCKRPISVAEISNPVESPLPLDPLSYSTEDDLLALCASCKKLDLDVALVNEVPSKTIASSIYDLLNSSIGVFTTFHINRIWHLCYKLDEYFSGNLMSVITYMRYVLNQKSFIKQCPHCRQERILDYSKSDLYPEVISLCKDLNITTYSESQGCKECNFTGSSVGIQPYVEYIIFDNKLKTELAKCSTLYEMEMVIRKKVDEDKTSLEYFVLKGVECGDLHPNQLINLL